jgi:hypothetical protein
MAEEIKPKFLMKSEFSMGQYDFIRYDKILTTMDQLAIEVGMMNVDALKGFHAVLWELYKNFRPIIIDAKRTDYEKRFREIKGKINQEISRSRGLEEDSGELTVSDEIIDELDNLQMDLLEIKQLIGLGIMLGRTYTKEELIAKGLVG